MNRWQLLSHLPADVIWPESLFSFLPAMGCSFFLSGSFFRMCTGFETSIRHCCLCFIFISAAASSSFRQCCCVHLVMTGGFYLLCALAEDCPPEPLVFHFQYVNRRKQDPVFFPQFFLFCFNPFILFAHAPHIFLLLCAKNMKSRCFLRFQVYSAFQLFVFLLKIRQYGGDRNDITCRRLLTIFFQAVLFGHVRFASVRQLWGPIQIEVSSDFCCSEMLLSC